MKTFIKYFAMILGISFFLFSCESNLTNSPESSDSFKTQTYIVTLNGDGNKILGSDIDAEIKDILSKHNIKLESVQHIYTTVLRGFAANLTSEQVAKLQSDKRIGFIEKDMEITLNDQIESISNDKGIKLQAQSIPWGINAVGGSVNATTSTGVAWIVDTGIDLTHADLNVNTTLSKTFITSGDDALSAKDLNGHGTHCAGIVAAKNNDFGSIGVCAGATVIAVKVLNYRGSGSLSVIVAGLDYVGKNLVNGKLNVVNMSLGGSVSTTLDNAVKKLAALGAHIAVAAGNSAALVSNFSPARVEATRVYTISAFDSQGKFATFSNYGNPSIDFSAPGVSIYSTYKNGGYATMSGTSMATPHVCGILLARNGNINWEGYVTADKDLTPDKKARR